MAGNPLLLAMMAILNRNQELPRNRSDLYNKASDVLLHQWDVEVKLLKNPKLKDWKIEIALIDKQKMLRKVAYFMQSNKKDTSGNLISKSDLENILTGSLREIIERGEPRMIARVMIEELRRNFILCYLGADSYGFVHRTFLEYFCASEFVWQFKDDQTLTINQLINQVFGKYWHDESWHEVLRLICGMIESKFVAKIIDFLLEQKGDSDDFCDLNDFSMKREAINHIILAGNCFLEIRKKNPPSVTSDKLLKILKDEIEQESGFYFNYESANIIISLVVMIWQNNCEKLSWLKSLLQKESFSYIPSLAIYAIAQGWKEESDTLIWLKDFILQTENEDVREAIIYAIADNWKKDPDTLPWLKDRVLHGELETIQLAAVYAIVDGWKEDPDTLPFLKDQALHGDEFVRKAAVEAIIEGWKEDPDTLPWLKDCALQDEHEYVREAVVNGIIQNSQKDPELFEFLENIALNDPFERMNKYQFNPRKTSLEGLLENFGDNPKTLDILNQVTLNDADEKLRKFAQRKLREWETG